MGLDCQTCVPLAKKMRGCIGVDKREVVNTWKLNPKGKEKTCPRLIDVSISNKYIQAYSHYEKGFLMNPGCILDQPDKLEKCIRIINNEISLIKEEKLEELNKKCQTNPIGIQLKLKDEVEKRLKVIQSRFKRFSNDLRKNWAFNTVAGVATIAAFRKVTGELTDIQKVAINTNSEFETWQVQMRTFTKDAKEARAVLNELVEFSVATPFTPGEVIEAGQLLKPLEQMGFELDELLTAAGNVAASFPIDLNQSAEQLVRIFTSGIGAADLFREKGVRSFIELKEGVDLTKISADELRDVMLRSLTTGQIGEGMKRLSTTFEGLKSTLQGEGFLFKQAVGEGIFNEAKLDMAAIVELIRESKKEGGEYKGVIKKTSSVLKELFENTKEYAALAIVSGGQIIDIYNETAVVIKGLEGAWASYMLGILKTQEIIGKAPFLPKGYSEVFRLAGEEAKSDIRKINSEINILREKANVDYSQKIEAQLIRLKEILDEKKQAIKLNEEEQSSIQSQGINNRIAKHMEEVDGFVQREKEKIDKLRELKNVWIDEDTANSLINMQHETERLNFFLDVQKKAHQSLWSVAGQARDTFANGTANSFAALVKGSKEAKKAATDMGVALVQILIKFGIQKAVNSALSKTLLAGETVASVTAAKIVASAWSAAAASVSLASFGANSGPAIAGMVAAHTTSKALSKIPGLQDGGNVEAPGSVLVGERGPELLDLPRGARVTPLDKGSNGVGDTIIHELHVHVEVSNSEDAEEVGTKVGYELEKALSGGRSGI